VGSFSAERSSHRKAEVWEDRELSKMHALIQGFFETLLVREMTDIMKFWNPECRPASQVARTGSSNLVWGSYRRLWVGGWGGRQARSFSKNGQEWRKKRS
jgi:hypothetical protein